MNWLFFLLGMMAGGFVGVVAMCLCIVSGRESRRDEGVKAAGSGYSSTKNLTKRAALIKMVLN